jgi:hypothetical protein
MHLLVASHTSPALLLEANLTSALPWPRRHAIPIPFNFEQQHGSGAQ